MKPPTSPSRAALSREAAWPDGARHLPGSDAGGGAEPKPGAAAAPPLVDESCFSIMNPPKPRATDDGKARLIKGDKARLIQGDVAGADSGGSAPVRTALARPRRGQVSSRRGVLVRTRAAAIAVVAGMASTRPIEETSVRTTSSAISPAIRVSMNARS